MASSSTSPLLLSGPEPRPSARATGFYSPSTGPERLSRSPYRLLRLVAALALVALTLLGELPRHRVLGNEVFLGGAILAVIAAYLLPRTLGCLRASCCVGGVLLAVVGSAALFESDYAIDFGMMEHWSRLAGLLGCFLLLDLLNTETLRHAARTGLVRRSRRILVFAVLLPTVFLLMVYVLIDAAMDEEGMGLGILPLLVAYGLVLDLLFQFGRAMRRRQVFRRGAGLSAAMLALLAGSVSAGLWYELRELPERPQTRMSLAVEVYDTLKTYYPYWSSAAFTPEELWGRHRDRLFEADRVCGDDREVCTSWLHGLDRMLADMNDAHTYLSIYHDKGSPMVVVRPIEGRAVITAVGTDSEAEHQGVVEGTTILSVDGVPVSEALARVPPASTIGASGWTRNLLAYSSLLRGRPGSTVEIEIDDGSGAARSVVLRREPLYPDGVKEEEEDSTVYFEILEDGILDVWLDGMEGYETAGAFAALLLENPSAPGFVLDLRDNSGGYPYLTEELIGHFWATEVKVGARCEYVLMDSGERERHCYDRWAARSDPFYAGPLAVLINGTSFSAAEAAASALCESGRARCFGSTTGGEVDSALVWDLPGAEIHTTTAQFLSAADKPLLGVGVEPHERIERTIEDVRLQRDPARDAALAWLRHQGSEGG